MWEGASPAGFLWAGPRTRTVPPPLVAEGRGESDRTKGAATMHRTTPGTLARLSLYRTLRRFAGPLLAFRLAFAGRTEA